MVFRAEAREVETPLDRFEVWESVKGGRAIALYSPAIGSFPNTLEFHRYPEGDRIELLVGPDAEQSWREHSSIPAEDGSTAKFDFDGDGDADSLVTGNRYLPSTLAQEPTTPGPDYGVVQVVSGRDGRVLFEDKDELEYENWDRAIPLGDLDSDGCSELALLHPRMNRSAYDFELWDLLFGAKSWVTVVSGARATRESVGGR